LLADYSSTDNLRAFAVEALKHPELGGYMYASRARADCMLLSEARRQFGDAQLAYGGGEDVELYRKRAAAYDRLQRRCGAFIDVSMANSGFPEFMTEEGRKDVYWRRLEEYKRARNGRNAEATAQVTKEIFATRDPVLAEQLGLQPFVGQGPEGQKQLWLDGAAFNLQDQPVLREAIDLLPCRLGLACGQTDRLVLAACLFGSACFDDRVALVKATTLAGDPAKAAELDRLLARLEEIIRSGDVAAIGPPRR
jgi:hypothetical protein